MSDDDDLTPPITRRQLLALGAAVPTLAQERELKVVVVGGHPDDPESGCGGTMARYADGGHRVTALYLTRGEAGISGKPAAEAALIRSRECEIACTILRARPVFAGQVDGATEVNSARYEVFRKLLVAEDPDVIFAQWPIDTHRDHRAASLLTYDFWRGSAKRVPLYYYEVMTGSQTQNFSPTDYVDITSSEKRKLDACFAQASQNPEEFYRHHARMNEFRGLERRVRYSEAFIRHSASPAGWLP